MGIGVGHSMQPIPSPNARHDLAAIDGLVRRALLAYRCATAVVDCCAWTRCRRRSRRSIVQPDVS